LRFVPPGTPQFRSVRYPLRYPRRGSGDGFDHSYEAR
jgi:hypothetical protein